MDEIHILLSSNRVSDRQRAKREVEDLIRKENEGIDGYKYMMLRNISQWKEILISTFIYEEREVSNFLTKGKTSDLSNIGNEIPIFVRKVVKHCLLNFPHILSDYINKIISTSLEVVVGSRGYSTFYKNEVKNMILDLMTHLMNPWLSFNRSLCSVYAFLMQNMDNVVGVTDVFNQKLLRKFCNVIIRRDYNSAIDITEFVFWLNSLLNHVLQDTMQLSQVTALVCECISNLIVIENVNIYHALCTQTHLLLKSIVRVIYHDFAKDNIRDVCLRYLYSHIEISSKYSTCNFTIVSRQNPLYDVLDELSCLFMQEEFCKCISSNIQSHSQNSSSLYIWDGPKFRIHLKAITWVLFLSHAKYSTSELSSFKSTSEIESSNVKRLKISHSTDHPNNKDPISKLFDIISDTDISQLKQFITLSHTGPIQSKISVLSHFQCILIELYFLLKEYEYAEFFDATIYDYCDGKVFPIVLTLPNFNKKLLHFIDLTNMVSRKCFDLISNMQLIMAEIHLWKILFLILEQCLVVSLNLSKQCQVLFPTHESIEMKLLLKAIDNCIDLIILKNQTLSRVMEQFHYGSISHLVLEFLIKVLESELIHNSTKSLILHQIRSFPLMKRRESSDSPVFFIIYSKIIELESKEKLSPVSIIDRYLVSMSYLRDWIEDNIHMDLGKLPITNMMTSLHSFLSNLPNSNGSNNELIYVANIDEIYGYDVSKYINNFYLLDLIQTRDNHINEVSWNISIDQMRVILQELKSASNHITHKLLYILVESYNNIDKCINEIRLKLFNISFLCWLGLISQIILIVTKTKHKQSIEGKDIINTLLEELFHLLKEILEFFKLHFDIIRWDSMDEFMKIFADRVAICCNDLHYIQDVNRHVRMVDEISKELNLIVRKILFKTSDSSVERENITSSSSSSSIGPYLTNQKSKQIISQDDDFLDDVSYVANKRTTTSQASKKIQLPSVRLQLLLNFWRIYCNLESTCSLKSCGRLIQSLSKESATYCPSIILITFAEDYVSHYSTNTLEIREVCTIVLNSLWEAEMGCFGYFKVLQFIRTVLSLRVKDSLELLKGFTRMVLGQEIERTKIHLFGKMLWLVRLEQLNCCHALLTHWDQLSSENQDSIIRMFEACIVDDDLRVRFQASSMISDFLSRMQCIKTFYSSLLSKIDIVYISKPSTIEEEEQVDESMTTGIVIYLFHLVKILQHTNELHQICIWDILKICISRYRYSERFLYVNFRAWMYSTLVHVSSFLEYSSVTSLIRDELPWLLSCWIEENYVSPMIKDGTECLALELFPYKLLMKSLTYKQFLSEYLSIIIPIVVRIQDPTIRWNLLSSKITMGLELTSNDNSVVSIILDCFCPLSALGLLTQSEFYKKTLGSYEDSKSINELLDRMVVNANQRFIEYISDIISFIFKSISHSYLGSYRNIVICDKIHNVEYFETQLLQIFLVIYDRFHEDISNLLSKCNLIDIVSMLYQQLISSKYIKSFRGIIASLCIIIDHIPISSCSILLLEGIFFFLCTSIEVFTSDLESCLYILKKFLDLLRRCIIQAASIELDIYIQFLFQHLLLMYITLGYVEAKNSRDHVILNDDSRDLIEQFISEKYARILNESYKYEIEILKKWRHSINLLLREMMSLIDRDECFKIPIMFQDLISTDLSFRITTGSGFPRYEQSNILSQRINEINKLLQIDGIYVKSLVVVPLWFMLLTFMEITETDNFLLEMPRLWDNNSNELAQFISSVLAFLQDANLKIPKALKTIAASMIGKLGLPDIYSINQFSLPQRRDLKLVYGDLQRSMQQLVGECYYCLFDKGLVYNNQLALIASNTLKSLGNIEVLQKVFSNIPVNDVFHHFKHLETCFSLNQVSLNTRVYITSRSIPQSSSSSNMTTYFHDPQIWSTKNKTYSQWICGLSSFLLYRLLQDKDHYATMNHANVIKGEEINMYIQSFLHLCSYSERIAELLFPILLLSIRLCFSDDTQIGIHIHIGQVIQMELLSTDNLMLNATKLICDSLLYVLRYDIINFTSKKDTGTTTSRREKRTSSCPYSLAFDIGLVNLAEAAMRCGCYCSATFLGELVHDSKASNEKKILFSASQWIHDPDAILGLQQDLSLESLAKIYSHNGQWMEALSVYESMVLSSGRYTTSMEGLVSDAVSGLGLHLLVAKQSQQSNKWNSLSEWSNEVDEFSNTNTNTNTNTYTNTNTNMNHFENMIHLCSMDPSNIQSVRVSLIQERLQLIDSTSSKLKSESGKLLIHDLMRLQELTEIEEVCNLIEYQTNESHEDEVKPREITILHDNYDDFLFRCWNTRFTSSIKCDSQLVFSLSILTSRLHLVSKLLKSGMISSKMASTVMDSIVHVASMNYNAAHIYSALATSLEKDLIDILGNSNTNITIDDGILNWRLGECKLLWLKKLPDDAIHKLKGIISLLEKKSSKEIYPEVLRQCGEWLFERKYLSAVDILNMYLEKSIQEALMNSQQRLKSLKTISSLYVKLYLSLQLKVSTNEWKNSEKVNMDRLNELKRCKICLSEYTTIYNNPTSSEEIKLEFQDRIKQLQKYKKTLEMEIQFDEHERRSVIESKEHYLIKAMEYISEILVFSSEDNLDLSFQFINLWFSNVSNVGFNDLIGRLIKDIPTYKFVPLSYQIFSRLGTKGEMEEATSIQFQETLERFVCSLCLDHPHHTLPQLFALIHEDHIGAFSGAKLFQSNMSRDRYNMALRISHNLTSISTLVSSMRYMLECYIDLASSSTEVMQKSGQFVDISFDLLGSKHGSFHTCIERMQEIPAVITISHPISKTKRYEDITKISRFHSKFAITETGLSRPKIIKCVGDNGVVYTQLVKGGDDMRQDAVMEQVFENLNYTCNLNKETRKRRLMIRTYKIIPTSPQTGIIEWVNNTKAYGSYLQDAHVRYHPHDWSPQECREKMRNITDKESKEKRFQECCSHFQPVFRYYFIEKYADPVMWVSCRLAYTRSVAASSIIGYILGIGDRHCHNILIDSITAEVVHIDFGLVFEQSKLLPVPELVPFRLTRDMIDGMGICGTEGTFRKSCQEVLRVMRSNMTQLMTILEVVIHDPLYKWSLSPQEARLKQNKSKVAHEIVIEGNNDANITSIRKDTAERTLNRIKNKLLGNEDPTGEALGIEGQVSFVINEATSLQNLSKMFHGWAAWM